jgi:para-nitrobenzyl esterase
MFTSFVIRHLQGIPYAEPPVGNLRFRPTRLKNSWTDVLDATKYGPPCAQRTKITVEPLVNSSEDCLHVNIYADPRCLVSFCVIYIKTVSQNKSCPVFFYVHGGGFYFDAPTMFNETLLMQNFAIHETIFVMPAYRLGIFGFLDSDRNAQDGTPQNAGLLGKFVTLKLL